MQTKKVLLKVDKLQPGMITAQEITTESSILVGRGVLITEEIIKKLKEKYLFQKIAVYCNDFENEDTSLKSQIKTVEDVENTFTQFTFDVEKIFDNMEIMGVKGVADIEELRGFSKVIQDQIGSTGVIIKNIVLGGSGNDSIYRHSVNVAALSAILGKWIGLNEKDINLLTYASILHDFGKTKINKKLLNKTLTLTKNEKKEIRNHPVIGYNYVKKVPFLDGSVGLAVLFHHERLDGSGYPLGIKEDKIPLFARIIAIADTFDAINSNRSYKKSRGPFEVMEIIQKDSLGKLDYKLCKTFLDHIINYYIGEEVILSDKRVCKIIKIDINDFKCPLLMYNSEFLDLKKEKGIYVEKMVR